MRAPRIGDGTGTSCVPTTGSTIAAAEWRWRAVDWTGTQGRAGGWDGTAVSIDHARVSGGMTRLVPSIGWGLAVGASLLVGALAAARITLPERTAATLTAFGG